MAMKKKPAKKSATKKRAVRKAVKRAKPAAVVLASASVPAIGQPWPGQNGIRIAECLGENGPNYHLVLVTGADGKPVILENKAWGEYGKTIKGADSHRDGLANTDAMLAAGNDLAKEVRSYAADAYLPSICELGQIRANFPGAPKEWFWSSTQDGANYARCQDFEYGYSYWSHKDYRFHAFVVRRVPIQ